MPKLKKGTKTVHYPYTTAGIARYNKDKKKLKIIDRCGEIEFRLVEGSDEFIQLESLLAFITYLSSKE